VELDHQEKKANWSNGKKKHKGKIPWFKKRRTSPRFSNGERRLTKAKKRVRGEKGQGTEKERQNNFRPQLKVIPIIEGRRKTL